ncbi:cytochrome P450 2B4-like isoform X2 [Erpetoichthys calabaricus]|uniref:cytochrome P450 2B4-like isoform X2 n=1 Tax=Erpetoichthys calabaricus TaxID=27687 RepID=UPI002234A7B3|nr:cytochrome P450 2B4-like isoform X2 [Erpetoichthys calabaricus]
MELFGTVILAATLLGLLFLSLFKRDSIRYTKMPPGPTPLPVIGNLLQVNGGRPHLSFIKMSETYSPVMTVHFGQQPAVVLVGFKAVHEALVKQADAFSGRAEIPVFMKVNEGYGLVFTNGEHWKQLRRFSLSTFRDFGMGKRSIEEWIQEEARYLVEEVRKNIGHPFDPTFFLSHAASNIICCIIFGQRFGYHNDNFLHLLSLLNTNVRLLSNPFTQLYNIFPSLIKVMPGVYNKIWNNSKQLKQFVSEQIEKHRETLMADSPRDYIDNFLIRMKQESTNPSTEFDVNNLLVNVSNFFTAGTETTSTTLRYGLLILIKYPHFQEKIHQEIDSVIGRERPPFVKDRRNMPFTEAVIHEIQRFIDLLPLSLPHVTTQDISFRGYNIPAKTVVFPVLHSVLFDKTQWESPYTFNPRHFLDENDQFKINPAFMPFSAGKRICAGEGLARMELFLFFVSLLQNFSFSSTEDPEKVDLTPYTSSLLNVPQAYKLNAHKR